MKNDFYHAKCIGTLVLIVVITFKSFAQGFSPQTKAKLQKVLDSFQHNPANPFVGGLSAAIHVDELATWQGATGFAARNVDASNNLLPGGTPFTTSTPSRIYSITKTFTAPLVLQLAQEKYFSLDDPIRKYMPLIDQYNKNGINTSVTIRQLLAHTSGYSDWEEELNLQIAIAAQPKRIWTPYELVAYTHQLESPGGAGRYSHNNYVFLGAIIEAATGKSAEELFVKRFFEPLHLSSMNFAVPGENIASNLAAPHDNISAFNSIFQATNQPIFPNGYTNISQFPMDAIVSLAFTGGAIVSDVADIAKWGNALFGGRATGKLTLDTMLQSLSPSADTNGNYLGYGIKKFDKISSTTEFLGHNGSAPGYRSVMLYNPERQMTIAILANFAGADVYAVAKALFEALPELVCGNKTKKEEKVQACFKGLSLCIPRQAARGFIEKGAYLGACTGQQVPGWVNKSASEILSVLWEQARFLAFPNPFSNHTTLSFQVAHTGMVSVGLYNSGGHLVKMLHNGILQEGSSKQVSIEGGNLAPGIYLARLQTATGVSEKQIVHVR